MVRSAKKLKAIEDKIKGNELKDKVSKPAFVDKITDPYDIYILEKIVISSGKIFVIL